ncbi:protamine-3-like [Schistocerca americana]|uniref:protamine-3-like n=1 Tax=Schistocerca americana TaxID=7009 RepID=UPI001F4FE243|nr:protamine-3-like [Schistocerca americana]
MTLQRKPRSQAPLRLNGQLTADLQQSTPRAGSPATGRASAYIAESAPPQRTSEKPNEENHLEIQFEHKSENEAAASEDGENEEEEEEEEEKEEEKASSRNSIKRENSLLLSEVPPKESELRMET